MGKDVVSITGQSLAEIADKLAVQLYGKSLADCLGVAQGLSCSKFKSPDYLKITVIIPKELWNAGYKSGHINKNVCYINSMIAHCKKKGFHCVLITSC
jgi:hypothetical protein